MSKAPKRVRQEVEVEVFWKHRNEYEWHLRDAEKEVIAKGLANSYAAAQAAGAKQAKRLTKKR
ncbi:hypothetical protein JQ575_19500 [Bradyrhizobium sp. JYMT SZCCT0428]|nr:hypothetical protein [Bradyrhizobium sp. JYMT SZCCT0428]